MLGSLAPICGHLLAGQPGDQGGLVHDLDKTEKIIAISSYNISSLNIKIYNQTAIIFLITPQQITGFHFKLFGRGGNGPP